MKGSADERAVQIARMEERFGCLLLAWLAAKPKFSDFTAGALTHITDRIRCFERDLDLAVAEAGATGEDTQEMDGLDAAYAGEAEAEREQHRRRYARRRGHGVWE